jgi:DnaD/phage-associated family protein
VLLALADHADKEGFCFPGVDRLATKTGLSNRMVQKHLEALKSIGVIEIYYNEGAKTSSGYTNKYRLLRGELQDTPLGQGVKHSSPDGVKHSSPDGVKHSSPKPPVEPKEEPTTTTANGNNSGCGNIFELYQNNISPTYGAKLADMLKEDEQLYPFKAIEEAVSIACLANKRDWRYVRGILKKMEANGYKPQDKSKTIDLANKHYEGTRVLL